MDISTHPSDLCTASMLLLLQQTQILAACGNCCLAYWESSSRCVFESCYTSSRPTRASSCKHAGQKLSHTGDVRREESPGYREEGDSKLQGNHLGLILKRCFSWGPAMGHSSCCRAVQVHSGCGRAQGREVMARNRPRHLSFTCVGFNDNVVHRMVLRLETLPAAKCLPDIPDENLKGDEPFDAAQHYDAWLALRFLRRADRYVLVHAQLLGHRHIANSALLIADWASL